MKFRHIVFAAAATFVALTGCNKEIDYGPAKVEVDKTEIEVPKDAGSVTVSLNATIDWAAKVDGDAADWLDISPSAGGPSLEAQTLTIKYTGNTGFDREASILVQGDVLHKTFINVKQKGEQGDPSVITRISVKEFLEKKDTEREYILEGEISNIANASYYGFDLTDATGTVACAFPTNFADFSASLKKGGVVKIQGKYAFYESKQTHQLQNGLILEYTAPADVDPSKIETVSIKEFITKADPKTPYRIVGEASDITYKDNYKAFTVSDDSGETLCIYSPTNYADFKDEMLDAGAGIVSVYGTYEYYASKQLHEMVDGVIESFTPGQGGGDDYENAPAKTVDEFVSAADGDTYYKLTGTVSGFNAKYCSFDLTDKTGKIYVYSVINKDEWSSKVQDGGTVTLAGKYLYYEKGSKHEVVDAYILSFDDGQGGGEGDDDGATAEGIVVAVSSQAFLVQTASGYTYVFAKADPGVKVGDEVKVSGTPGTYAGLPQINEPTTTVVSSGNSVKYPEPKTLDGASMDSYDTGFGYVKVTGNLTKSGNYYNLDVKGSSRTGSLSYPVNVPDALVGKTVDVTGFFVGITGNIYFNILAVDLKESANQDVETLSHPLTSGIKWTLGTNGYDGTTKTAMSATVNGTKVTDFIKLGTSSAGGDATLAIPAGVKKIGFYAAGWKTTQSEESSGTTMSSPVTIKVGGKSLDVKRNKGCTSNPPFTITFSDETDYYEVEVTEDSSVKIEAPSRIVIIGINAI